MIAFNNEQNDITWQASFVAMLPEIEQKLRLAFCRLDPEAREDAIEEGVCILNAGSCLVASNCCQLFKLLLNTSVGAKSTAVLRHHSLRMQVLLRRLHLSS